MFQRDRVVSVSGLRHTGRREKRSEGVSSGDASAEMLMDVRIHAWAKLTSAVMVVV